MGELKKNLKSAGANHLNIVCTSESISENVTVNLSGYFE